MVELSKAAVDRLKQAAGVSDPEVIAQIIRLSKWTVRVNLVKGLCLHAAFKFNCKTLKCERIS